ncbi:MULTISPECIES: hypothetical protein [Pseudomonas]|uniref:hypothetical protein n=1 Tax=Pseudomonas TaxID=286 RepID=UPI0035321396
MSNAEPRSPLTIIAIFAGIIEASALASLPFLSEESQTTYTWFLVGFPFFLTVLFFLTLNFNYKSLYLPSNTDAGPSLPPHLSTDSALAIDASIGDPIVPSMQVQMDEISNEAQEDADTQFVRRSEKSPQCVQARVTITLSGARANQLFEHFATHALKQVQFQGSTWTLYNMETGTRTTLTTQSFDR